MSIKAKPQDIIEASDLLKEYYDLLGMSEMPDAEYRLSADSVDVELSLEQMTQFWPCSAREWKTA